MTEAALDGEILESKAFAHKDTFYSGKINATLYSGGKLEVKREDDYTLVYNFSLLISDEDRLLFFNELANAISYERFKFEKKHAIELWDAHFAHFLIEQKLPKSLAVRLAVVAAGIENPEEMWTAYRNLKQAFFYNQKTGQSSFEIYLLMAKKFGIPFADSVFKLKALSLDTLEEVYEQIKNMLIHDDAKGLMAVSTPESLETFLIICRFMNMRVKQNALVTSRLVSDDGSIDWNLVTELNARMTRSADISDLASQEDAEFAFHFENADRRFNLFRGIYELPSRDYLVTVLAVLIAKYGMKPIVQAVNKIREDKLTNNTFAAFIVVTDFIGQTGDTDTNLQWVLLLSGDMDEDNFS